jgi:hypothetical protein
MITTTAKTDIQPKITTDRSVTTDVNAKRKRHIYRSATTDVNVKRKTRKPHKTKTTIDPNIVRHDNNAIENLLKYQINSIYEFQIQQIDIIDTYTKVRFDLYKKVQDHIKEIITYHIHLGDNDDIIQKMKNCLINNDIHKHNFIEKNNNKIILMHALGNGSFGIVFDLQGKQNNQVIYHIACKLMVNVQSNINELLYYIMLKQKIFESHFLHFPLMYAYLYCDNIIVNNFLPKSIQTKPYFMLLCELGDGTLYDIINPNKNNIENENYLIRVYNAIEQLILGLCYFNSLGHYHYDAASPKNFLYKKLPYDKEDIEYFKYEIKMSSHPPRTIIVQNMGFLWVLNDFGNSRASDIIFTKDISALLDGILFFTASQQKHEKIQKLMEHIHKIKNCIKEGEKIKQFIENMLQRNYFTIYSDIFDCFNDKPYIINFDQQHVPLPSDILTS